jgi:photosystem II stability/assembly factor-like uncharacterized protein
MYRVQNQLAGMDPIAHEKSVTDQYELNFRFFIKQEALSTLAQDPENEKILREQWMYDGMNMIYGRNSEYWRQIQSCNHIENWKSTNAKVLVQFGESDFQAFSKADHEQIVRTVNYYHPGNATLMTFPLTDHYYAKSGTMQEAYGKFTQREFVQLFDAFNFDVSRSAIEWSLNVIASSASTVETEWYWKKLKTSPYPGKQDDIFFIDRSIGWYLNGFGAVYQTNDGCENWEKIFEKKGSFFRTLAFLDDKIGFLGTVGTDYFPNVLDTIPLYKTIDGGITWTPVSYTGPYVKGLCAIDIVKEPFINHGVTDYRHHIFAVGRVGSPANLMVSNDGGESWSAHSMDIHCKMLFDIKMFDKYNGIACGATNEDISQANALILKTNDGGLSWKKVYQSNRPFETTWKATFPTDQVGFVTLQSYNPDPNIKQQRIVKTTNGGESWVEYDLVEDHAARPFGIGFINEHHGYVGTMQSGYETKDGGVTWEKVDMGKACNKIRIMKDFEQIYGYAIGVEVLKLTTKQ